MGSNFGGYTPLPWNLEMRSSHSEEPGKKRAGTPYWSDSATGRSMWTVETTQKKAHIPSLHLLRLLCLMQLGLPKIGH